MAVRRVTGLNNHAGDLVPQTSAWGQALKAGEGQLIDQPEPIGHQGLFGYGGTVGGFAAKSASVIAIQSDSGFWGDVPQSQQSLVDAADPWNRA